MATSGELANFVFLGKGGAADFKAQTHRKVDEMKGEVRVSQKVRGRCLSIGIWTERVDFLLWRK